MALFPVKRKEGEELCPSSKKRVRRKKISDDRALIGKADRPNTEGGCEKERFFGREERDSLHLRGEEVSVRDLNLDRMEKRGSVRKKEEKKKEDLRTGRERRGERKMSPSPPREIAGALEALCSSKTIGSRKNQKKE